MEGTFEGSNRRVKKKSLYQRLVKGAFKRSRRRIIRFSILSANLLVLVAVLWFVLGSSKTGQSTAQHSVINANSSVGIDPLDQLSSADVAVNVARMTGVTEATSVTNHADTVNAVLTITPSDQTIVAKPAIVATVFKSNKDIKAYVTQSGDTVSSLAKKFNVTSDSIINSNGLSGNGLTAGKTLYIPPVNGLTYIVKKGDTPTSLANKFNANAQQITAYNDAELGGLKPGERIIIPNGTITIVTPAASTGLFGTFSGSSSGSFSASFGANGYDFGWCTWYVANRRAQMGHPVPNNLGDASSWYILAQRAGLPTGLSPRAGAVAVSQYGNHVAVVERVNPDGSFIVSEMNSYGYDSINTIGQPGHQAGGWSRVDYKQIKSSAGFGFIY